MLAQGWSRMAAALTAFVLLAGGGELAAPSSGALAQASTGDLTSIACPGANLCFAVGADGSILQWGGTDWIPRGDSGSDPLYDVACANSSRCFAVGAGGTVLGYDGSAWSGQSSPTHDTLYGVA